MAKKPRAVLTSLERIIRTRERTIQRMKTRCLNIETTALREVESLKKKIAEQQSILDALKRGARMD